ncbi:hypothetical protein VTK56DRAFT_3933 [Thermocarpiscus australiensis]
MENLKLYRKKRSEWTERWRHFSPSNPSSFASRRRRCIYKTLRYYRSNLLSFVGTLVGSSCPSLYFLLLKLLFELSSSELWQRERVLNVHRRTRVGSHPGRRGPTFDWQDKLVKLNSGFTCESHAQSIRHLAGRSSFHRTRPATTCKPLLQEGKALHS